MHTYLLVKRLIDTFIAVVGGIIVLPVTLIIAMAIKLTSSGPIIYSQIRIGLNEHPFRIYKFRTMINGADKLGSSISTTNDKRITPLGKVLRRSKLDEIPQLWNVIIGDMSLVGPRPDVPKIIEKYSPEMREILTIRPGITSLASLYFRDEAALLALSKNPDKDYIDVIVPAKVALSMQHVRRKSILFDVKIVLQTIWVLTGGHLIGHNEESETTKSIRQIFTN